jgi:hypothetical protein
MSCHRDGRCRQKAYELLVNRWWILVAAVCWPALAYRGNCQAVAGDRVDSAQVQLKILATTRANFVCRPYILDRVLTQGQPAAWACLAESHDTSVFTYNAPGDLLAVAGRRIRPDSASITHLSDATEAELKRRYGKPVTCVVDAGAGPPVTRYLLWRRSGYVVQFRTTRGSEVRYPGLPIFVDVEVLREERGAWPCLDWVEIAGRYQ